MRINTLPTTPVDGMKPGTSGLRKKVQVVREGLYLHNFVQALFDTLPPHDKKGATLVVSGDGRYYNREAIQVIIEIAAANGVGRLWIGKGGIMSTPAVSAVIREREGGVAVGGIILTASHNPGGPEEDFGIKYNMHNGEPALEAFTDAVYKATLGIEEIQVLAGAPKVNLDAVGVTRVGEMVVEVIDPVADYLGVLKEAFDFEALRAFVARPGGFKLVFDAMHGVAAPYAQAILGQELGCPPSSFLHADNLPDFGGLHPDPNLAYASELVAVMGLLPTGAPAPAAVAADVPDLGAAADGDADRNMILGKQFFVTPSDSLALIAANADAIPFFRDQGGLKTVARSMPTSQAVDRVAKAKGLNCVETPTGWKYFGNLMDAQALGGATDYNPILCGEESFGTGSNHVREKDGLWAVLAWLSVLAHHNPDPAAPLKPISAIVQEHWAVYGRNYYCRYDYETVDSDKANAMMAHLRDPDFMPGLVINGYTLTGVDDFAYVDPVDGSQATKQGVRLLFGDGTRAVFRLSGTGSTGATIRMYLEKYEPDVGKQGLPSSEVLKPLADLAIKLARLEEFTGRTAPTVIT